MRRVYIDFKTHAIVFQREADDAAAFRKTRGLADRQNRQALDAL